MSAAPHNTHPPAWMITSNTIKMTATARVYSRSCMLVTSEAALEYVVTALLVFRAPTAAPDTVPSVCTCPELALANDTTVVT